MSEQKVKKFKLKRPDEFFTSPKECSAIQDVKKELQASQAGLLDLGQIREQEDWSFLANRVVGAEGD